MNECGFPKSGPNFSPGLDRSWLNKHSYRKISVHSTFNMTTIEMCSTDRQTDIFQITPSRHFWTTFMVMVWVRFVKRFVNRKFEIKFEKFSCARVWSAVVVVFFGCFRRSHFFHHFSLSFILHLFGKMFVVSQPPYYMNCWCFQFISLWMLNIESFSEKGR